MRALERGDDSFDSGLDEVDAVPGGCHFAGDDHAMQAKAQAARIAKTLVLHAEGAVHALVLDN